jgi:hypothetical protein
MDRLRLIQAKALYILPSGRCSVELLLVPLELLEPFQAKAILYQFQAALQLIHPPWFN